MSIFDRCTKPPRAFFVFACAGLVAFFAATNIAGLVIDKASPLVVFGSRAKNENITVVFNGRGSIKFSNGSEVRGIKLLPFDVFFGCATVLMGVGLWWGILKVSMIILKVISPPFAEEIWQAYRQLLAIFRVQTRG